MSVLVLIAAAYVVGTKLLDCWTTRRFVPTAAAGAAVAAWSYTLVAAFVGIVQAAVAATKATGRFNAITRAVYRLHTLRARRS